MIDFQNASYVKLRRVDNSEADGKLAHPLLEGETLMMSFRGMRDMVVFTSKRIIALNLQGITGKKKDYTSLPYNKVQAWSVETAGNVDVAYLSKLIGHFVLN